MGRTVKPSLRGACAVCGVGPRQPCVSIRHGEQIRHVHSGRPKIGESWRSGKSVYAQLVTRVLMLEDKNPSYLIPLTGMSRNTVYRHISEEIRPMSHKTAFILLAALGYRVDQVVTMKVVKVADEPIRPGVSSNVVKVKLGEAEFTMERRVER